MKRLKLPLMVFLMTVGCKDADPVADRKKSDAAEVSKNRDKDSGSEANVERTPAGVLRELKAKSASSEELLKFAEEFPGTEESFSALSGIARDQELSDDSRAKLLGLTQKQFVDEPSIGDPRAMEAMIILLTAGEGDNRAEVAGGMYERFVKDADDLSPSASRAISIILQIGSTEARKLVIDSLAENHADDPSVVQIVRQMEHGIPGPDIEKLLTDLAEKSSDEKIQGVSLITLAKILAAVPDMKSIVNDKEFAAGLPAESIAYISDFEPADHADRITDLLNRVSKDYADVDVGGKTLGEIAEDALFVVNHLSIGKEAPDIEGEDIDGVEFKLSDYRGKVVLVDFWGDW